MILPGIGKVLIVDDKKVTEQDIWNNFFLTPDSLGKDRGEETFKYLIELNPDDVSGKSIASLGHEGDFDELDLIIATDMNDETMKVYGDLCAKHKVPIIFVRCYG